MRPRGAPVSAPPQVTAGGLARVRPNVASPYAGRSGLVLGVEAGAALLRFGSSRAFAFSLDDLYPVVNVSIRGRQR